MWNLAKGIRKIWKSSNLFKVPGDGGDIADLVGALTASADLESGELSHGDQRDLGVQDDTEFIC